MRAIPTTYRGFRFRSRLEAKWASFFDRIDLDWEFEPQAFETSAGPYLPDFWLPAIYLRGKRRGMYLEVKPGEMTAEERAKATALAYGSGSALVVTTLVPGPGFATFSQMESLDEFVPCHFKGQDYMEEDSGLTFSRCAKCKTVNLNVHAGHTDICPCGCLFDPFDKALEEARAEFPNLARWERAA